MKITAIVLIIISSIIYGQGNNLIERLKNKNLEERMKAIEEVIEKKIIEARPIIEEEIKNQELWLQPLYIEALKILESDKIDESIENYARMIAKESETKKENLSSEFVNKIIESNREIIKYNSQRITK